MSSIDSSSRSLSISSTATTYASSTTSDELTAFNPPNLGPAFGYARLDFILPLARTSKPALSSLGRKVSRFFPPRATHSAPLAVINQRLSSLPEATRSTPLASINRRLSPVAAEFVLSSGDRATLSAPLAVIDQELSPYAVEYILSNGDKAFRSSALLAMILQQCQEKIDVQVKLLAQHQHVRDELRASYFRWRQIARSDEFRHADATELSQHQASMHAALDHDAECDDNNAALATLRTQYECVEAQHARIVARFWERVQEYNDSAKASSIT